MDLSVYSHALIAATAVISGKVEFRCYLARSASCHARIDQPLVPSFVNY
jgi:hypothetical protein